MRRAIANKRLHINQRTSSALGEFIKGLTKHHYQHKVFGHIISAVSKRKKPEHFNDGMEKECPSAVFRVEKITASLQLDVQLPVPLTHIKSIEGEYVQEEVADIDEDRPFQRHQKWKKIK